MEYTKGEWEVYKWPEGEYPNGVTSYGLRWAIQADKKGICYINDKWLSSPPDAEMEANARLIASAPDLYEALKELIGRDNYGSIRLPTQARDIMVKALAKVEGGN